MLLTINEHDSTSITMRRTHKKNIPKMNSTNRHICQASPTAIEMSVRERKRNESEN